MVGGATNLVLSALVERGLEAVAGRVLSVVGVVALQAGVVVMARRLRTGHVLLEAGGQGAMMAAPLALLSLVSEAWLERLFISPAAGVALAAALAAIAFAVPLVLAWRSGRAGQG